MFIRKKKLLKLIDEKIKYFEDSKCKINKDAEEAKLEECYIDGLIDGLDLLKREFTPFKH